MLATLSAVRDVNPSHHAERITVSDLIGAECSPERGKYAAAFPLGALRFTATVLFPVLLPQAVSVRRLWLADVATMSLPAFERTHPGDPRGREAIEAHRQYALGYLSRDALRAAESPALRPSFMRSRAAYEALNSAGQGGDMQLSAAAITGEAVALGSTSPRGEGAQGAAYWEFANALARYHMDSA